MLIATESALIRNGPFELIDERCTNPSFTLVEIVETFTEL